MFWRVPGFSQPSPVEQILDKDEFSLEELLDEDDIIQECKSLNSRLISFLRQRSTVEQLLRYLVEAQDSEDPKRTYKYPFTSCEVLCCELEAVYNTMLEEPDLMRLLFSLLDTQAPLNCKTAGYFGRVVGNLLLRKNIEMLVYLQSRGNELLEKLVKHVDTTSVADVIKRLVGADDQNSLMPPPDMAQWLADAPLVDLLLARLADSHNSEAQANAADILSATAHTQPSPLAGRLSEHASVAALVEHALAPSRQVLVPALDVCIALIEPRRAALGDMAGATEAASSEAAQQAKNEAVTAIVQHLPRLIGLLSLDSSSNTQATPCGLLTPPLGRHRLKVVELLAVLVRSSCAAAEEAVILCSAIPACLRLFSQFSFNNLLHHNVASMLLACMSTSSEPMIKHLFEEAKLIDWIVGLPILVVPTPRPGHEEVAAAKAPLRAGYLGHVTQIAGTLEGLAHGVLNGTMGEPGSSKVAKYTEVHEGWARYLAEVLHPQQDLENTSRWACGRPSVQAIGSMDSDGDDFSHEMDLEQLTGMQPLYHRYSTDENEEDEGDDDDAGGDEFKTGAFDFGTDMITDAISGMDITGMLASDSKDEDAFRAEEDAEALGKRQAPSAGQRDIGMDDDEVLLATSDEEFPSDGSPLHSVFPIAGALSPGAGSPSTEGAGASDAGAQGGRGWQDQQEPAAAAQGAAGQEGGGPVIDKARVWQGATWQVDVSDEV